MSDLTRLRLSQVDGACARRPGSYQLSGTDLRVSGQRSGWSLYAMTRPADDWIFDHGLAAYTFPTRQQAVDAVIAAAAISPLPEPLTAGDEPLLTDAAGMHVTADGAYSVRPVSRGTPLKWAVLRHREGEGGGIIHYVISLTQARAHIALDRYQLSSRR